MFREMRDTGKLQSSAWFLWSLCRVSCLKRHHSLQGYIVMINVCSSWAFCLYLLAANDLGMWTSYKLLHQAEFLRHTKITKEKAVSCCVFEMRFCCWIFRSVFSLSSAFSPSVLTWCVTVNGELLCEFMMIDAVDMVAGRSVFLNIHLSTWPGIAWEKLAA